MIYDVPAASPFRFDQPGKPLNRFLPADLSSLERLLALGWEQDLAQPRDAVGGGWLVRKKVI
jgi:hypothetical protein